MIQEASTNRTAAEWDEVNRKREEASAANLKVYEDLVKDAQDRAKAHVEAAAGTAPAEAPAPSTP